MPKPECHIFVCVQRRPDGHPRSSCAQKSAEGVFNSFAQELIKRNLQNRIALTQTGCLGPCQAGANVLIYPGATMYSWIEPDDAATIIDQHLLGGEPLQEKLTPAEIW